MRINDIINESWPGDQSLSLIEFDDFLKIAKDTTHPHHEFIKSALFSGGRQMYRGISYYHNRENIKFINIKQTPVRSSPNTDNYYTWWIDNFSKKWKDYPKRSRSFICSTSEYIAGGFGATHLMIPTGPTVVGQCSSDDFWSSFGFVNPNVLNNFITHIMLKLGYDTRTTNLSEFKKVLKATSNPDPATKAELDKIYSSLRVTQGYREYMQLLKMNDLSLVKLMDAVYDPVRYRFDAINWPESHLANNREVWFRSDCYMIPNSLVVKLKKSLQS